MGVTNMQCETESQMKDYIQKYPNEDFRFDTCFLQQVFTLTDRKLVVDGDCILSKYRHDLAPFLDIRNLNTSEQRKYRFNPKVFSYDVYGTTEMWFLVLYANELYSTTEFDLRRVKYYNPGVFQVLTHIVDLEQPFININEEKLTADLKAPMDV